MNYIFSSFYAAPLRLVPLRASMVQAWIMTWRDTTVSVELTLWAALTAAVACGQDGFEVTVGHLDSQGRLCAPVAAPPTPTCTRT